MPREARLIPAGVVVHVICRFVNGQYLMGAPWEREEMHERAGKAAANTDWKALHYAYMGTHAHWAFLTGEAPLMAFFQPLNTGFAGWTNRRRDRHGPVFSNRPRVVIIEGETSLGLGGYIHNNPPRAGVCADPKDCDWTSHQAYVGLAEPPPWLHVQLGLELMGLAPDAAGARDFDRFAVLHAGDPRDPKWSGGDGKSRRTQIRRELGAPLECATAQVLTRGADAEGIEQPIVCHAPAPIRPRWEGAPQQVIAMVCAESRVSESRLLSRERRRDVVAARRLCLSVWTTQLGRPAVEMAVALGISEPAASRLRATCTGEICNLGSVLGERIWALDDATNELHLEASGARTTRENESVAPEGRPEAQEVRSVPSRPARS